MSALLVALGAAVGAPLRYLADRAVQARHDATFPWGTFTVNTAGSALLGLLLALPVDGWVTALAGTGFCGALTTYSTFAYETVRLAGNGERLRAILNVAASIAGGLGAAWCGTLLAQALS
ncbi:fluoride efflux transporter CrcB [Planomonospora venezuelensis]|uniref:Fluoride-specific ion channel FluC n=1 Tax=Planomonospora venezuelensis TaxID=1999 RepID=A0A841D3B1_PLAVE|nr:fluoride efflux transporter CrcB [Planomonospora venezuelensis]MBB5962994.1 CrcB protein [Planomonospora venezuelensis]GIN00562.1 putative fluoride ion transporter CrcB 2 [Planomonospora venezuelensis]